MDARTVTSKNPQHPLTVPPLYFHQLPSVISIIYSNKVLKIIISNKLSQFARKTNLKKILSEWTPRLIELKRGVQVGPCNTL